MEKNKSQKKNQQIETYGRFKVAYGILLGLIAFLAIFFLFEKMIDKKVVDALFIVWLALAGSVFLLGLIAFPILNGLKRGANFNRYGHFNKTIKADVVTKFKDLNDIQIEFFESYLLFDENKIFYDDINFEYLVFNSFLMMSIIGKELDSKPFCVLMITNSLYDCVKHFNLNVEQLERELDFYQLNYKDKKQVNKKGFSK